jgi:acetyltransferase-like isoleucine patch superfamily enzyme
MSSLRNLVHRHPRLYAFQRRARMMWKRWRYGLKHVHPTFYMSGSGTIARDFRAGAYSFINDGCYIGPKVSIGPYVMFGPRVAVIGGDHRHDIPGVPMFFAGRAELNPTVIEADAWIGYGAMIMAGVTIGRGAIVAAGSVITKDVPPYEIHAGVPARKIGERFPDPRARQVHDIMLSRPPEQGQYPPPIGF